MISALYYATAELVGGFMLSLWALNLYIRDPTFIDAAWGTGFVIIALKSALEASFSLRSTLILLATAVWGVRLSIHLLKRWLRQGADDRYVQLLKWIGGNPHITSLVFVFLGQGFIMWLVSLPIQTAAQTTERLNWINYAGLLLATVGIIMGTVADHQLANFRRNPANEQKVLNTGLWRYSRHPNYFADTVFWWGIYALSFHSSRHWSVLGPVLMTLLLRFVSGVPLLEKNVKNNRPGYHAYMARTNAFVPWPPSEPQSATTGRG